MRSIFASGILSLGLLAVGCGDAVKLSTDDINGITLDTPFAIFTNTIDTADLDFDGVDDADVSILAIVASDQEDLCGALTADPDALANIPDLQAVQVTAIQVFPLGQGADFAEGTIKGNAGLFEVFFGGAVGDIAVSGTVSVRQGGVDKIQAFDDGIGAAGIAVLELNQFVAGDSVSMDFTTTLTAETADAAFFDTDTDADGVNDLQTLANTLELSVKNVAFCAANL